jgi:hypothetical protein
VIITRRCANPPTKRRNVRERPNVLLTTPESIEALRIVDGDVAPLGPDHAQRLAAGDHRQPREAGGGIAELLDVQHRVDCTTSSAVFPGSR